MSLRHDLRLAARQWVRQRRLAAAEFLTVALGIGGATTMYVVRQSIRGFGVVRPPALHPLSAAASRSRAAACYLPARHAASVDPVEVLRCE